MLIKAGVDISRLRPEIRKKLNKIAMSAFSIGKEELVITSTYEGNHSEGSLHYANLAIDIQPGPYGNILKADLRGELGASYDVILENDHIHIEYDPK